MCLDSTCFIFFFHVFDAVSSLLWHFQSDNKHHRSQDTMTHNRFKCKFSIVRNLIHVESTLWIHELYNMYNCIGNRQMPDKLISERIKRWKSFIDVRRLCCNKWWIYFWIFNVSKLFSETSVYMSICRHEQKLSEENWQRSTYMFFSHCFPIHFDREKKNWRYAILLLEITKYIKSGLAARQAKCLNLFIFTFTENSHLQIQSSLLSL